MPTREDLKELQSYPLDMKIWLTRQRIREWVREFGEDGVYVSFSGGKDSTVLLDIVRKDWPNVEAVFVNTGLEYPEIVEFVKRHENVTILRPKKNFRQVLTEYGYPVISKEVSNVLNESRNLKEGKTKTRRMQKLYGTLLDHNGNLSIYNIPKYNFLLNAPFRISDLCCDVMKKRPAHNFEKNGKVKFLGQIAEESLFRKQKWLKHGCNAFDLKRPESNPLSFWTNNDILTYIHTYKLPIASVYGDVVPDDKDQLPGQTNIYDMLGEYQGCKFKTTGCERTGCMFCLFGAHLEKGEGRLERIKRTHPKIYDYVLRGGEFDDQGKWIPSNDGLGFKFVIDWLNENGNLNIKY